MNQLIEVTPLPGCGVVLIDQRKMILVEGLEEFVPTDFFQRVLAGITRKLQPNYSGILAITALASRGFYHRGMRTPAPRPTANFFVIRGGVRKVFAKARGRPNQPQRN